MNIAVLTRRALISPTNLLLTALAVADLLTMVFILAPPTRTGFRRIYALLSGAQLQGRLRRI